MSDSLSSFIASGIEFIVGGLMLLGSVAFLVLAAGWDAPEVLSGLDWQDNDASLVILGLALAAAYAAGVVGEGLSRLLLEWDLERITVRNEDFLPENDRETNWPRDPDQGPPPSPTAKERRVARRLGEDFTATDLKRAKTARERQRSAAASHPGLLADIESQLKRLRIERISFLCALIVALAFACAGEFLELLVTAVVAAVLFYLVHERFTRYCGSIARAYDHVERIEQGKVSV